MEKRGELFSAGGALWFCVGLFSVLLLESVALSGAGGGGVVPSGSERLSGRFPCLGEQRCVCE